MARLLLAALIALCASGLAFTQAAADADWALDLCLVDESNLGIAPPCRVGTATGATDGFDSFDLLRPATTLPCPFIVSSRPDLPPGLDYLLHDIREPVVPGSTRTWDVVVLPPIVSSGAVRLTMWNSVADDLDATTPVRLAVHIPPPAGQPDPGALFFDWDPATNGSCDQPACTFTFASHEQALKTTIRVTLVPEPSGYLAMSAGLCGMWLRRFREGAGQAWAFRADPLDC